MPIFQRYTLCETCTPPQSRGQFLPSRRLARIGIQPLRFSPPLPPRFTRFLDPWPCRKSIPSLPFVLYWRIHTYTRLRPSKEVCLHDFASAISPVLLREAKTRSWQRQLVPINSECRINPGWFKEIEISQAIFYIQFQWFGGIDIRQKKFSPCVFLEKKKYVQLQSVLIDVAVGPNLLMLTNSFSHSFFFSLSLSYCCHFSTALCTKEYATYRLQQWFTVKFLNHRNSKRRMHTQIYV